MECLTGLSRRFHDRHSSQTSFRNCLSNDDQGLKKGTTLGARRKRSSSSLKTCKGHLLRLGHFI